MSTQEMKFGNVVSVCTMPLNQPDLISLRNNANATGRTELAIPRKLIAKVFSSTWPICFNCVGLLHPKYLPACPCFACPPACILRMPVLSIARLTTGCVCVGWWPRLRRSPSWPT